MSADTIDLSNPCPHVTSETPRHAKRPAAGCKECLEMGDTWVHLRLCLSCGHVGCCDNSKNRHATKHFRTTNHPLIQSFQPGEDWGWCYIDEVFLEPAE